ncbi:DUF2975 domain-containing protein [Paenibacillus sp. CN-4]|uniref:DUF2975 domain-containing protein n=1 Tax=Paenibacillus nanchangensis TaxID=3348343 RepID=UPI00397B8250
MQLRNLVGSLSAGSPFVPDNVNRLRRLAFVIIAYSVLSNIFMNVMYRLFVHDVFSINVAVSLKGLGIGLLVLCIAEVFRHGVYYRRKSTPRYNPIALSLMTITLITQLSQSENQLSSSPGADLTTIKQSS